MRWMVIDVAANIGQVAIMAYVTLSDDKLMRSYACMLLICKAVGCSIEDALFAGMALALEETNRVTASGDWMSGRAAKVMCVAAIILLWLWPRLRKVDTIVAVERLACVISATQIVVAAAPVLSVLRPLFRRRSIVAVEWFASLVLVIATPVQLLMVPVLWIRVAHEARPWRLRCSTADLFVDAAPSLLQV